VPPSKLATTALSSASARCVAGAEALVGVGVDGVAAPQLSVVMRRVSMGKRMMTPK
jgi:hypothetical protein